MRLYILCLIFFFGSPAWSQNSGTANSNDASIYYETYGHGPTIVLINGGPGMNSRGFAPLAKAIAEMGYQVVLFDQRGTGHSLLPATNSTTITMDLMVADMEAIRQQLELDEWIVMGHSFGGILASYYTSKHPDNVTQLIYSASGGLDMSFTQHVGSNINNRLTQNQQDAVAKWSSAMAQGDTSYNAKLARGTALAPAYLVNTKHVPAIAKRLTEVNLAINRLVFQDLQRINYNCHNALQSFKKPVLIIQGKQDIIGERTARNTLKSIPHAQFALLQACGHYGWLDQPEQYFEIIQSFLAQG